MMLRESILGKEAADDTFLSHLSVQWWEYYSYQWVLSVGITAAKYNCWALHPPKTDVFCLVSWEKVYICIFMGNFVIGTLYVIRLQNFSHSYRQVLKSLFSNRMENLYTSSCKLQHSLIMGFLNDGLAIRGLAIWLFTTSHQGYPTSQSVSFTCGGL